MHASPTDALLGRTLAGRYRVAELIGTGGMASVYRCTSESDPNELAIKILDPKLSRDPKFVRRFEREAKSASRLKHRSTVRIFDYGVDGGLAYIAMELLRGAELAQILEHEHRLSEARAARIMGQVCSALAAAHDLGVVHRDLKPENIMVLRDPKDPTIEIIKVLDFGIAKMMERDVRPPDALPPDSDDAPPSFGRTMLTMIGTIVGTPEYMSPEQCRGETIDARSDVYSCGVLLFHLVTGRLPFVGETPVETTLLHATAEPPRPSSLTPTINPKLEALIVRSMAKAPADRPQSAREMQEELLELMPELAVTRHATQRPPPNAQLPTPAAGRPAGTAYRIDSTPPDPDGETKTLRRPMPAYTAPSAAGALNAPDSVPASSAEFPKPIPQEVRPPEAPVPAKRARSRFPTDLGAVVLGVGLGAVVIAVTASTTLRVGIGIVAALVAATALVIALRR